MNPLAMPTPPASEGTRQTLVVVSVLTVVFLAAMEGMVTSTIMPSVIGAIGGMSLYPWVTAAFMLASTVTTPIYGKLSDVYGRKRFILIAIAIFLLGSVLCGLARDMVQLIVFRAVQGIGAGGLLTMSFTVFGVLFPPESRARMQGLLSSMWALASIAGPLVGAICVQWLTWQWAFFLNVPLGLLAAWLIATNLRLPAEPARGYRMDYLGIVLFGASVSALLAASMAPNLGWGRHGTWQALALAAGLFVGLTVHERRVAEPILPVPLFRQRAFAISVALAALGTAGFFATMALLPLFLQGVLAATPAMAGQALMAISIGWVLGAFLCGRLLNGQGFRRPTVFGTLMIVVAYGAFYLASAIRGLWPVFVSCGALGVGMGFVATSTLLAIQTSAPRHMLGAATSGSQLFRTVGGTLGVSVFGGLQLGFFRQDLERLAQGSVDAGLGPLLAKPHLILDAAARTAMPPTTLALTVDALAASIHHVFLLAGLMSLVGVVLAWRMPTGSPSQMAAAHEVQPAIGD
jgi:EmrB/QacA subfamily drug resistance transporter